MPAKAGFSALRAVRNTAPRYEKIKPTAHACDDRLAAKTA
jgi:hypothetical protein